MTKVIVFDDDPTGTQSASGVEVVLDAEPTTLAAAMSRSDSVYVLTNTRAIPESTAVALLSRLRDAAREAAAASGDTVQFVLRGDSTLRGHVFAEIDVLADPDSVVLFVPAFPAGGRTTRLGVHYVRIDGEDVRAHQTEFASDPVFPFSHSYLPDYVAEKSGRPALSISGSGALAVESLRAALISAAPGTVVIPDAEHDSDIVGIAQALAAAIESGRSIVVRSAAPLAAAVAGVTSARLLTTPLLPTCARTLLVCGSHTNAAGRQLARVEAEWGRGETIVTANALEEPITEGQRVATLARERLERGFVAISTERVRRSDHGMLAHGELVMTSVTEAVRGLRERCEVVISKGGITSAAVASKGLGATTARVLGQVLAGVSVWSLDTPEHHEILLIVVPGNVGDDQALVDSLAAVAMVPGRDSPC